MIYWSWSKEANPIFELVTQSFWFLARVRLGLVVWARASPRARRPRPRAAPAGAGRATSTLGTVAAAVTPRITWLRLFFSQQICFVVHFLPVASQGLAYSISLHHVLYSFVDNCLFISPFLYGTRSPQAASYHCEYSWVSVTVCLIHIIASLYNIHGNYAAMRIGK